MGKVPHKAQEQRARNQGALEESLSQEVTEKKEGALFGLWRLGNQKVGY